MARVLVWTTCARGSSSVTVMLVSQSRRSSMLTGIVAAGQLSSCIFQWDEQDVAHLDLRNAKRGELRKQYGGHAPREAQITASITTAELARHCRRKTRGVEDTRRMIKGLLGAMWDLTDSTGLPFINKDSMAHVWEMQQNHLSCIQEVPGVDLYTTIGQIEKGARSLIR